MLQAYLHMTSSEQVLYQGAVGSAHASMVDGKAVGQDCLQVGIIAGLCLSLHSISNDHKQKGKSANTAAPKKIAVQAG